jgi:hypothetical protein
MKEATGELNMTVITVVAIAAVGALFTFFVWPNIQANLALNTACSQISSTGNYSSGEQNADTDNGTITCSNFDCTAIYNSKTYQRNCKTEKA